MTSSAGIQCALVLNANGGNTYHTLFLRQSIIKDAEHSSTVNAKLGNGQNYGNMSKNGSQQHICL